MPWMESAYFERAIFSLGSRVDVSARARLFTGGTRRALELRDRICTHPYCYEPAESCQGDHIEPYAEGRARPPRRTAGCSAASTTGLRIQRAQRGNHPPPDPAAAA